MRDSMMLSSNRDLLEAEQLQDLWCSLSLRHVSLEGGRCSCGREHVTLRLTDFEEDIGEYLYDDAARGQRLVINLKTAKALSFDLPPICLPVPTRSSNDQATRVHHAAKRRGGRMAGRSAGEAAGDAGSRCRKRSVAPRPLSATRLRSIRASTRPATSKVKMRQ
jgi:hypothetical protein